MQKILVHDEALKPIATVPLDGITIRYLHDYRTVRIPLPCDSLAAAQLGASRTESVDHRPIEQVTLNRVTTPNGWRVTTTSPAELIMRLPEAVKAGAPTAGDTFQKALYNLRRGDEALNEAYQENRLRVIFSCEFHDEIRVDPQAMMSLVDPRKETIHGIRYLVDQHQEVPIKFVMEV